MEKQKLLEKAIQYDLLRKIYRHGALTEAVLEAIFAPNAESMVSEETESGDLSDDGDNDETEDIPVTAEDSEGAEKSGKRVPNRKIDKGKLFALADADWNVKDIAAELHCAPVTVYNILRERKRADEKAAEV